MAKVLYITANPKPVEKSFSLQVGETFLNAYKKAKPEDTIVPIDLFKEEIPPVDGTVLNAWDKLMKNESLSNEEQRILQRRNEILEQFMEADKYIFVTPLWNLSIPSKLKDYIDNIVIAQKTFAYSENGPVGLLKNKKAVHIQATGGIYSGPASEMEFGNRYLKTILAFIGITDYTHIVAEGMSAMPDKANEILEAAKEKAKAAAIQFAKEPQLA
jgi:FMN-dependent NADH-azoreductase